MNQTMSLSGDWRCKLDRGDEGVSQEWFREPLDSDCRVVLPGSLPAQGIGDKVALDTEWTGTISDRAYFESPDYANYRRTGNIKVPFWLQPETYFVGAAWFQREIEIPASWAGRRVRLFLERPHWQTRVWLDGREAGSGDSLSTPHEIDLGKDIAPGLHLLTIRVDNRLHIEVGDDAHSVTDHTQGNWNGIIGRIELNAAGSGWMGDLQVFPHAGSRSVTVRGKLGGAADGGEVVLEIVKQGDASNLLTSCRATTDWTGRSGTFEARVDLGAEARLWDEFDPALYELHATFAGERKTVLFGLREFSAQGTQFAINGRPTFLRGTLDCCIFPLTGHPPMDVASWREILVRVKRHGLNHVRFHSWCPPEAAFVAGNELGVYFQVECAVWPNVLTSDSPAGIGDGNAVDRWAYEEGERILRAYGNHPCFVLMACGNEPGGSHHKEYLADWVAHFRRRDGRRFYTGGAAWPELPENDFHVIPNPRVYQWGDCLKCRLNGQPPETTHDYREIIAARSVPVISHEIGQWCAYPPVYDTGKYRGYLKARNYEIFAESLAAHHMADQARDFVRASGRLQVLCYKEEIESALRTPGMGGFQLLGLQDFPGQGTAPVGLLDAFWDEKGYLTAGEMRRFCNATVPLARLRKRVFATDELLDANIEVAHFGAAPMENAAISWKLVSDAAATVMSGEFPPRTIPLGSCIPLGRVACDLATLAAPARYRLVVSVASDSNSFENDWDIWLYPRVADTAVPPGVVLAATVPEALAHLAAGRNVLLMPHCVDAPGNVAFGFTPIFWNTSWNRGQPPHTLGILCDPRHPALAGFPTNAHTDWQWWEIVRRSRVFVLDGLPPGLRPIVQVIDDWFTNRRLGLVFEARVAGARLLVCGIDLRGRLDEAPAARQLLESLLRYAGSSDFSPSVALALEAIDILAPCSAEKSWTGETPKS